MTKRHVMIFSFVVLLGALLFGRSTEERSAPTPRTTPPSETERALGAAFAATARERLQSRRDDATETEASAEVPTSPLALAATQARRAARFRPGSGPFDKHRDPVASRLERVERTKHARTGDASLTIWLSEPRSSDDEPAALCARVSEQGGPSNASIEADLHGRAFAPTRNERLASLSFQPEPACDGALGARVVGFPSDGAGGMHPVVVRAPSLGLSDHVYVAHAPRRASFTGALRAHEHEDLVGAHLRVEVEIDVVRGGRFYLAGSFYDAAGEPVGTAESWQGLAPGRHELTLELQGLLLCDAALDGPLRLGALVLEDWTEEPGHVLDSREGGFETAPLRGSDFSCVEYGDPEHRRRAAYFERLAGEG